MPIKDPAAVQYRKGTLNLFVSTISSFLVGVFGLLISYYIFYKWKDARGLIFGYNAAEVVFKIFGFGFSSALLIFGFIGTITIENITRPPRNNPSHFLASKNEAKNPNDTKVLVCLGDSITHGRCSANYVDQVSNSLKYKRGIVGILRDKSINLDVVNAGQNSLCSWTLLHERIPHAIACQPDFVSVLIGTNDIKGVYKHSWGLRSLASWSIPDKLSFETYERNLNGIVQTLVAGTRAKIGLMTLPPMGEDLDCKANEFVRKANAIVRDVAKKYGQRVTVVDIYQDLQNTIKKTSKMGGRHHSVDRFLDTGKWMYPLHSLGLSWNVLSRILGNKVLSDSLHMNEHGAKVIAQNICYWLESCEQ